MHLEQDNILSEEPSVPVYRPDRQSRPGHRKSENERAYLTLNAPRFSFSLPKAFPLVLAQRPQIGLYVSLSTPYRSTRVGTRLEEPVLTLDVSG